MKEKRRILVYYMSSLISVILVMSFMYLFNGIRYECVTEDEKEVLAKEINVQGEVCFGKINDGTYVQIKSYKEVPRFDFIVYIFLSIVLYIAISFAFYKIIFGD